MHFECESIGTGILIKIVPQLDFFPRKKSPFTTFLSIYIKSAFLLAPKCFILNTITVLYTSAGYFKLGTTNIESPFFGDFWINLSLVCWQTFRCSFNGSWIFFLLSECLSVLGCQYCTIIWNGFCFFLWGVKYNSFQTSVI